MSARALVAALAVVAASAGAASKIHGAELDLKGKTVTVYIAGGVGAGLDSYARTLMPYLGKYLPGTPTMVASNMPGAGGVQGM